MPFGSLPARASAAADALLNGFSAKGEEFERYMAYDEREQSALMLETAAQEAAYSEAVGQEYWAAYVPPSTTAPSSGQDSGNTDDGEDSSSRTTWLIPAPYFTLTNPMDYI